MKTARRRLRAAGGAAVLLLMATARAAGAPPDDLVARGEYLFHAAGCGNCHTDADNGGAFLAGGYAFSTPFGTFYSPNITPHREHGIGTWSEQDFIRAMKAGVAPEGTDYFPVFPYTSYAGMTRADLRALHAYLGSVPPVAAPNRPHDTIPGLRRGLWLWKLLFFAPRRPSAPPDAGPGWERGAYLVTAVAHCGECHTPRNRLGAMIDSLLLAGTQNGPEGKSVPNITPHRKSGIGSWNHDDLTYYLRTGGTPDGDYAGGLMAEVIDNGLKHLTPADRAAIATFVLSVPAVDQRIERSSKTPGKRDEF